MLNRKVKILSIVLCMVGILIGISSVGIAESPSIVRYGCDLTPSIDPAVGACADSLTAQIQLFDPLVFPDTKVFGDVVPHLAKSWDVSSDGLTYTFYLNSGIKFHDGTELTAEDVKFSMDRLLTIGEGVAYLWLENIKETEVVGKYTIAFHMKTPFGPFLATLPSFFIVNKNLIMANIKKPGMYGDMGDYGKEYVSTHDVGSGPYMIKDYRRAEYLHMEKNPNYFLDISSAPDEFKMIGATEPTLVKTLMARRELEMTTVWLSPETFESLAKIEGVEVARRRASAEDYITMHTRKPPLDDIHVRRALAWAYDYDAVVKLLLGSVQAKGPVPITVPGSDPNGFQYHRDLERAKLELKQSKYYGHFDEYPMECQWHDNSLQENYAMLLMANAAEIGLTVNVVETTWSLICSDSASMEKTPHFHVVGDEARYPEAGTLLQARYHSMTAGTWEQTEWLLDPVFDEMIDDAFATIDKEERFAKYREASRYIVDLCPSIFLVETPECRAYQAAYMDWPAAKGEAMPYYGYNTAARFIKIDEAKREMLLK